MRIGTIETDKIKCVSYSGPSSADSTYVYSQEKASDCWKVVHGLNKYVSVSIVDTGKTEIEGDVQYVDENTVMITFSAPFSGWCYCN